MKAVLIILFAILVISGTAGDKTKLPAEINLNSRTIYNNLENESLSFDAFDFALKGFIELKDSLHLKENVISVVDYSQPSTQKRFYLINIKTQKILFQDYVAHGKNSGDVEAKTFSNKISSYQSSLGFFKTAETYYGKNGLSLRLDGLEKGINNQARNRAIVIHTAKYAEESFIKKWGRLGRSFGCPTIPSENFNEIIDLIKEGSLLFIYAPKAQYLQNSRIIN